MKFAFICGRDIERAQDTDGGSVLIRNLARALMREGHEIHLYTPENLAGGGRRERDAAQPAERTGIFMHRYPVSEDGLLLEPLTEPGAYFRNRLHISERCAEYFVDGKLNAYDRIYIFHMANAFGLLRQNIVPPDRTVLFPMLLGTFYRRFDSHVPEEYLTAERETLLCAAHIATASTAETEELASAYGVPKHKVLVARRGFDEEVFPPVLRSRLPEDRTRVLCANTIRPQKNQRFFLELAAEGGHRIPGLVIHLVGIAAENSHAAYGEYARALAEDIRKRKLERFFEFHPVMSQVGISSLMRACDLAFYPSLTETFGKSLLESSASGLPTIAFDDVPAYNDFIEHGRNGLLVPRIASSAIDAIEELRAAPGRYAALSINGAALAARFSWRATVEEFFHASEARIASGLSARLHSDAS